MEIEKRFTLHAAPANVWAAFQDVRLLVECLPGASVAGEEGAPVEPANVPLLFKVKLGPIAAGFKGQGQLVHDDAAQAGTFSGSAVDARTQSRVKGQARFALQAAQAGGTEVTVAVDYAITGALAQFGREGIVRALAEQLTREFADNLQARLPSDVAVEVDASPVAGAVVGAAPHPAAPVNDSSSIDLWTLFKVWLRQWLLGKRSSS